MILAWRHTWRSTSPGWRHTELITVTKGDLLKSTAAALVIPVNTKGVAGKGLALQWSLSAEPSEVLAYERHCESGRAKLGHVWWTKRTPTQRIVFFPTKAHWRELSRLHAIEEGLEALRALIVKDKIGSIAVPALGCGLGGLPWRSVKLAIEKALGDLPNCDVYLYPPHPARK